jgi:glutathione S-transferase
MLKSFDIPFKSQVLGLYNGTFEKDLAPLAPARQVPILKTPEGHIFFDTLVIAETLVEAHPSAAPWPKNPAQRGAARSLVAQMHSGFSALRTHCPMNLQNALQEFEVQDDLHADLAYLETLWHHAFNMSGDQDWLFGAYSLADVFFAPVAARIACYKLPVSQRVQNYVDKHLALQDFRQWRAMGLTKHCDPFPTTWPAPRHLGPAHVPFRPRSRHGGHLKTQHALIRAIQ